GKRVPAAGGQRSVDRRPDRRRRRRHLHRRRQVLVDRHAALQLPVHRPAVLSDPGRQVGRHGPRRRVPGDDDGLLAVDGSRRRAADLRPRRRVQLRQGATRPGGAGQPRLPHRAVPRRTHPQHGCGRRGMSGPAAGASPQELVERALAASKADDCVVLVTTDHTVNMRWANNTLTTNGTTRSHEVTVVSIVHGDDDPRAASLSRSGVGPDDVTDLVAQSAAAAAESPVADDGAPLVQDRAAADWDADPGETDVADFGGVTAGLAAAFDAAARSQEGRYGYAEHSVATTYLGTSAGVRLRHVQ